MSDLLANVVIPVANEDVAERTAKLAGEFLDEDSRVRVVHIVQDEQAFAEATEEEWEEFAGEAFERFRSVYGDDVETEIRHSTDIVEGIFGAAADIDATAIVFVPRGGSRWRQLMSGDVARELVTSGDRPVVALPPADGGN